MNDIRGVHELIVKWVLLSRVTTIIVEAQVNAQSIVSTHYLFLRRACSVLGTRKRIDCWCWWCRALFVTTQCNNTYANRKEQPQCKQVQIRDFVICNMFDSLHWTLRLTHHHILLFGFAVQHRQIILIFLL